MKTRLFLVVTAIVTALSLGILPSAAQETLPEAMIPADFAGFVRVKVESGIGISQLTVAAFTAFLLQPGRVDFNSFQGYDTLFPLTMLDAEDVTFTQNIQPWVRDAVIVAYRRFDSGLQVSSDDILMILPTSDVFVAASFLAPIIQFQDLPDRTTYRDVTIYVGDQASIALTPEAVFIGPEELIEAALDVRAGVGERLIDQPGYRAIRSASPGDSDDSLVFAFMGGEQATSALSILLGGDTSTEPLLRALGETLQVGRDGQSVEASLLTASLDAIGVNIQIDTLPLLEGIGFVVGPENETLRARATVTFYDADQSDFGITSAYDASILDMIPQNAMVVQTGGDVRGAIFNLLAALPLASFAGDILRAFPVDQSSSVPSVVIEAPSAADIQRAITGFLGTLEDLGSFSLEDDLLAHLSGTYAVALMPRPNDPTPVLRTPFDILILIQVDDGEAALNGASRLTELLTAIEEFDQEAIEGFTFETVREAETGDVVTRLGVVDNTLVVATGDSLESALDARRGDNRLINRERWQIVSQNAVPHLFVNVNSFLNTFLPSLGAAISSQTNVLAARGNLLRDGVFQLQVTMTVPTG